MEEKVTEKEAKKILREQNGKVIGKDIDGFVVLKDINKVYDNRVQAVFDFNLSVNKNEFIVLVGPSGCGKSTTLRMIAGLEEITSGELYIDGVLSNFLESKARDIAMVFQSYALYPNMTVYDNIGFGLKARGVAKDIIREKVYEAAEILDLGQLLDRKPRELSGGQMQRVALGRAIVRNAKLFLMDEPLSNLDAKLRVQMRSEIVKIHKRINATTVYVTHDQTEAMTMADRIVIMNKGLVQQIGAPIEIYNDPKNVFVATFIGNPPMNVFKTDISGGRITSDFGDIVLPPNFAEDYAKFISERRTFFERFKEIADVSEENGLADRIKVFLKTVKKQTAEERKKEAGEIISLLKNLSVSKGLYKYDEKLESTVSDDLERGDFSSLSRDFKPVMRELCDADLQVAGILKKFDSAGAFSIKENIPKAEEKTKKKKTKELTQSEKNALVIEKYLSAYSAEGAKGMAYVGIRPEDVHFAEDYKGKGASVLKVKASFVELLGSEYCVYIDIFGIRLIMKTGLSHTVKTDDTIEICFDMNKLKIFDGVSGERVI